MPTPSENLVALANKSIDDVKELATRVTDAVAVLDQIRTDYQTSKVKHCIEILKYVAPLIGIVILLVGVQYLPCGIDFEYGSFKIVTKACP